MINDPYQVLGVSRNATQDEIKKAYRQKARQYHPDTHPNDPDANRKMNEINEAYDMLTHPEKYANRQQSGYGGSASGYGGYGAGRYGSNGYGSYNSGSYGGSSNQSYGSGYQNSGYNRNGYNTGYNGRYGWSGNFDFEDFFNAFSGMGYEQGSVNINPSEQPGDSQEIRAAIQYINAGQYQTAQRILAAVTSSGRNARWYYLCSIASYGRSDMTHAVDYMQRAVQMDPNNRTYQQLLSQFMRSSRSQTSEGEQTYYRSGSYGGFSLRRILIPILVIMLFNWFFLGGGCFGRACYGRNYYYNSGQAASYQQEESRKANIEDEDEIAAAADAALLQTKSLYDAEPNMKAFAAAELTEGE